MIRSATQYTSAVSHYLDVGDGFVFERTESFPAVCFALDLLTVEARMHGRRL